MLKIFVINYLLYYVSASPLQDILRQTDEFFNELDGNPQDEISKIETFKMMLRRTYNLHPENHHIIKRSLDEKSALIHDELGKFENNQNSIQK